MIGTRGVPAQYGGFETAVEEIGSRLADMGHAVTVFCREGDRRRTHHLGMELIHLPALKHRAFETLSHSTLSVLTRAARQAEAAVVFNAANAPLIPILRSAGVPVALHVDGIEWKRTKWSGAGQRYYRWAERQAVRWADALIADARSIQSYYRRAHAADTTFIPYGATNVAPKLERLHELQLSAGEYFLVVARLEPENHVHIAIAGYIKSDTSRPLVVVGGNPYPGEYVKSLTTLVKEDQRVRMLGGIWDQELLDALYAGARSYVHGHSVGGTNPSLLRAMGAGSPVLAFDVEFNREVLGPTGLFWADATCLKTLIEHADRNETAAAQRGTRGKARALAEYNWDQVATEYERLCVSLAQTSTR